MALRSPAGFSVVRGISGSRPAVRLELAEVGGGIRELHVGDRPIIDGYGAPGRATAGRGQILAPWPNRLGDGAYRFDGMDYQLPLNDVGGRTAMHGLVRWLPWTFDVDRDDADHEDADESVARVAVAPQPGWPTWLELSAAYDLANDGLTVRLEAHNAGALACPFGLGMHPYLAPITGRVDDITLTVPAASRLVTDDRGLPAGWQDVEGSGFDFRSPRVIGGALLDTCFATGHDGFRVVVDDVTLWADSSFSYAQVFTGDTDPDPARRRSALAVEPMTCPPDAFRTGEGLIRLEPGERWQGSWGLQWPT